MLQISQLGKQILALEPNFVMSIYGMADMTACMVPDIWERRSLLHNCIEPQLLMSCWRRMCLWLMITEYFTRDIQQIVIWKEACWWNALRPAVSHLNHVSVSDFWGNTSLFQLYTELVYARRSISNVRIGLYRVSHIIGPTLFLLFSLVLEHKQRNFS